MRRMFYETGGRRAASLFGSLPPSPPNKWNIGLHRWRPRHHSRAHSLQSTSSSLDVVDAMRHMLLSATASTMKRVSSSAVKATPLTPPKGCTVVPQQGDTEHHYHAGGAGAPRALPNGWHLRVPQLPATCTPDWIPGPSGTVRHPLILVRLR